MIVAFLRGINLGRSRRVGMADLRAALSDGAFGSVRTYLQSGNVVLDTLGPSDEVAQELQELIRQRFGFAVDVVVRTRDQLAAVVAANPLADVATDGSKHFVVFLSAAPDRADVEPIEGEDFEPERCRFEGRELHLWCPDGVRDSRLTKALTDWPVAPVATMRNWNTVTKVLALAEG